MFVSSLSSCRDVALHAQVCSIWGLIFFYVVEVQASIDLLTMLTERALF